MEIFTCQQNPLKPKKLFISSSHMTTIPRFALRGSLMPIVILTGVWVLIMLFVGVDFGIEGDDIFMVSPVLNQQPMMELYSNYFSNVSARHYLVITLVLLYHLAGDSTLVMEWGFLFAWLINSILCFILLNRFFKTGAALLASIFFLVYAGKFEIVPVLSGGVYQFVLAILLIILLLLTAQRWSWTMRAVSISFFFWISIHWYELLIPFAPLLVIYYWITVRKNYLTPSFWGWICSCLPLAIMLVHISILASASSPIWDRSGRKTPFEVIERIPHITIVNYDALLGPRHWRHVLDNWEALPRLQALGGYDFFLYSTLAMAIALAALVVIMMLKVGEAKSQTFSSLDHFNGIALLILALYILAIAQIISWPVMINGDHTPPRFTYVPSLALAIFGAWIMSSSGWRARVAMCGVGLWILSEAVAMKMILFQYSSTASYDNNIRTQLQAFDLKPKVGETIFISLPENGLMHHVWKQAPSKFESGSAQTLLILDYDYLTQTSQAKGVPFDKILIYQHSVRYRHNDFDRELIRLINVPTSNAKKIHAFLLRRDNQLCAIKSIALVDKTKIEIIKYNLLIEELASPLCVQEIQIPISSL